MASLLTKFGKLVPNLKSQSARLNSTVLTKLMYKEHGDPIKVLQQVQDELQEPKSNEIVVRNLASPVNPADINQIQGKYPVKPALPAVGGNEAVGEVIRVGACVKDFAVGDRVIPLVQGIGTWSTHFVLNTTGALKVPKTLGLVEAATLTVNPCTAYRMLRDFVDLKPGDTVMQNGANSACGQNVIQICRAWGIRTVNIVRDRADISDLRDFLTGLGADHVLTEEELRRTDIFKSGQMDKPKLALNCVGGQNALEVLRHLQQGGRMVTYGGMSREPVTVPTSALIFKDVKVEGFWMTRWSKDNADSQDRFEMFDELISMMTNDELQGPACKMVDFSQFKDALMNTLTIKGMSGKKYILSFDEC